MSIAANLNLKERPANSHSTLNCIHMLEKALSARKERIESHDIFARDGE